MSPAIAEPPFPAPMMHRVFPIEASMNSAECVPGEPEDSLIKARCQIKCTERSLLELDLNETSTIIEHVLDDPQRIADMLFQTFDEGEQQ
jgi:hypothetical protein